MRDSGIDHQGSGSRLQLSDQKRSSHLYGARCWTKSIELGIGTASPTSVSQLRPQRGRRDRRYAWTL